METNKQIINWNHPIYEETIQRLTSNAKVTTTEEGKCYVIAPFTPAEIDHLCDTYHPEMDDERGEDLGVALDLLRNHLRETFGESFLSEGISAKIRLEKFLRTTKGFDERDIKAIVDATEKFYSLEDA